MKVCVAVASNVAKSFLYFLFSTGSHVQVSNCHCHLFYDIMRMVFVYAELDGPAMHENLVW